MTVRDPLTVPSARAIRAGFLACVACLVAACGVDESTEQTIGDDYARQIEAQLPLVRDPALDAYIDELGGRLAAAGGGDGRQWSFTLVNAEPINAFALPGGHVYVNRGLIERAENLSELAGVLGHEVSHVILRHSAERIEKEQKTNVGVGIVCALTNICSSELTRVAIQVGGAAWFARHSRQDELEADSAAVETVVRAGFDPDGIPSLFAKLMRDRANQPGAVEGWFASHPLEGDRVAQAERLIEALPQAGMERLVTDDERYQRFRQMVMSLPAPPPMPQQMP